MCDRGALDPQSEGLRAMLARLEAERAELGAQLVRALQRAHLASKDKDEIAHQLNVALEVIGEQTLRVTELEDDISSMKEIFRASLESAVAGAALSSHGKRPAQSSSAASERNSAWHAREERRGMSDCDVPADTAPTSDEATVTWAHR